MTDNLYIPPHIAQRLTRVQRLLDHLAPEGESRALLVPGALKPRDSVIVFPGSFNPPTTAHLALLKQAQQFARAHEPMSLYAAFSKQTVNKEAVVRPLLLERIVLLDTILRRRLPPVGILLFNRGLYVEQAGAIRSSFPQVRRILFLLGFDKIIQILDAHYYKDREAALTKLFGQAELLVAPRGADGEQALIDLMQQPQNKHFAHAIHMLPFDAAYRDISSTAVRQGGSQSAYEVPREAKQFMHKTRAYAPSLRTHDGAEIDYYGLRMQYLQRYQ